MQVSGFTIIRDGVRFGYPFVESIHSVLPLVDEFVVLVGDSQDDTLEQIQAIDSPKMVIRQSVWDPELRRGGQIMAQQTNAAMDYCQGDWCFYLQADEVVHENDLNAIERSMKQNLARPQVEGLSFRYRHFMGDYTLCNPLAYRRQLRIVRNGIGVRSVGDACGFAVDGRKLKYRSSGGWIYHYGWVRPPRVMSVKMQQFDQFYNGEQNPEPEPADIWKYDLSVCVPYRGSHPEVMGPVIVEKDWETPPFRYKPWWRNSAWWDRFLRKNFASLYRLGQRKPAM